jgi:Subtilase family
VKAESTPRDPFLSFSDPNLAWSLRNGINAELGNNQFVAVMVEFATLEQATVFTKKNATSKLIYISRLFLDASMNPLSRFIGALIQRKFLRDGFNAQSFGFTQWELGVPVILQKEIDKNPVIHSTDNTVMAVIDDFVSYRHPEFMHNGQSRFFAVWDQDPARSASQYWKTSVPAQPSNVPFGAEFSPSLGSDAYPKIMARTSHGTGVAGVLGGKTTPAYRLTRYDTERIPAPVGAMFDAASIAPMIAVHLPRATIQDTSGATLTPHVLHALHYIIARCSSTTNIVVNLSYGTMAGPHDSSAVLASAIENLTAQMGGRLTVYLASGNSRDLRCHATFDLKASKIKNLIWKILPECSTSSMMDIWLPSGASGTVKVTLTSPDGLSCSAILNAGASSSNLVNTSGTVVGLVQCPSPSSRGMSRAWARIYVSPTLLTVASRAAHGLWRVSLKSNNVISNVHAWIERNGTAPGFQVRSYQSRFVDLNYARSKALPGLMQDTTLSDVKRRGTLNGRATHPNLNVIGSYCMSNKRLAPYSSGGDLSYVRAPTMLAPGDESLVLQGLRVMATGSVDTVRLRGTSISTPMVAREAFNLIKANGSTATPIVPFPLVGTNPDVGHGFFDPRP